MLENLFVERVNEMVKAGLIDGNKLATLTEKQRQALLLRMFADVLNSNEELKKMYAMSI